MPNQNTLTFRVLLFTVCLFVTAPVFGQRNRSVSEADMLRREEVRDELGLSDTQKTKLEELQKQSSPGREFFEPYLKKIADTEDKDEQSKIRAEMTAAVSKQRLAFKENAVKVLDSVQKNKLRGIFIESAGTRIFSDPVVVEEYGLSEEQTEQISKLNGERASASRKMGYDSSAEDREKFRVEWNEKLLSALNDTQRARYEKESAFYERKEVAAAPSNGGAPDATSPQSPQAPRGPVISSFGGESTGETKRVEKFSFNFRGAPWEQVLQMYADGAGLTLELTQVPPGTFTHTDPNEYSARRTLDILNGALLRKGYAVIENDSFVIVMNIDNGIPPYLVPEVTIEELLELGSDPTVGEHQLVTVKIPVTGMETGRAAQEVEPLVGPHGNIIALTESRILIITDTGGSLRKIHGLLTLAMGMDKENALLFKSYPLRNMDAEEAQTAVLTQFGMQQGATNVSAAVEMQQRMQARSQSRTQPQQSRQSTQAGPQIQVAADLRLNSLLVTGTAQQHELVNSILTTLDVDEDAYGNAISRRSRGTYLEVYKVTGAQADEVAKTLTAMNMPGVQVVNEDGRAGTIHVMAGEKQHEEVAMLIRKLDGGGSGGSVAVIPLAQMDPLTAAATLRSLFYNDGDDAPTIETDLYRRVLIIRGGIEQITQIRAILADMGEDGSGVRQRGDGGTVRRFALQGRNPDDFVRILKQAWDANETQKINIVIPNESGPIRERRTTEELPGSVQDNQPASTPRDNLSKSDTIPDSQWRPWRETIARIQREERGLAATTKPQQGEFISVKSFQQPANSTDETGINPDNLDVIIIGDELLLSSPDEAMLDRLEDLLDELHQSMPFKPEYTVVYLKSADALEAADMLSQFFPSSSVATTSAASGGSMLGSLASGIGSMGSSLMDATGLSGLSSGPQSLKIIPDIRTNSLFMTGPQSMIKDALAFLDVIDSDNIPESLKDMQPHAIQVMYADVRDVELRVKELFKTYTEAQGGNNGRQNQQNPLAAMFGGGGKSNDPASQVRLLVEADEQTGTLYVNCNQQLFEAVEGVVKDIDNRTQEANPGIRVIQLQHSDASMIQQSLTNLLPRVSVSSSRTTGSTTGSSSNSSGGSSSNNAAQDAFQKAIQDRIRQGGGFGGQRGGTTGGSPFGGGRGAGGAAGGRGAGGGGFGGGRGAGGGRR